MYWSLAVETQAAVIIFLSSIVISTRPKLMVLPYVG
jgi:hypothetical protein